MWDLEKFGRKSYEVGPTLDGQRKMNFMQHFEGTILWFHGFLLRSCAFPDDVHPCEERGSWAG